MLTPSRRAFLGQSVLVATAAGCAVDPATGDSVGSPDGNAGFDPGADPVELEPGIEPITSNADFYHVSISGSQEVDVDAWTLTLQSLSGDTVALTLAELTAFAQEEIERTLMCIGSHSGVSTSNAMWRGVKLQDLLDAVGLVADSDWIWIESVEGYATCLPASDLAAGLRVIVEMNGVPLPSDHGGPARILTPGRYGMKNPKWITRIAFIQENEPGFWEKFGWSDTAVNHTQSWFLYPAQSVEVAAGELVTIKGCAFAGLKGITKVEVSADGATWTEAEITYAGGPDVWTLWRVGWTAPSAGTFVFFVRATDGEGQVQENLESTDDALDGLDKFHSLTIVAA